MSLLSKKASKRYFRSSKYAAEKADSDKYEDIIMIGYHSKLFRDDVMAKYIDEGKHLIPWMGDESLMIDRYDCRGYLYSQEEFTCKHGSNFPAEASSPEEEAIEIECTVERYLALENDLTEKAILEEEERKRFRSMHDPSYSFANVGFQYEDDKNKINPGDEEYDPSACFEDEAKEERERGPLHASFPTPSTNNVESNKSDESKHDEQQTQAGKYVKPENLEVPPEIDLPDSQKAHSIIEKTAMFISKQGTQMEIVLKAKQAGNPQFDFLNYGNWLNPYYKLILKKVKDGSYVPQPAATQTEHQTEETKKDSAHLRPVKTTAKPTPATSSLTTATTTAAISTSAVQLQPRPSATEPRPSHNGASTVNSGAVFQFSTGNVAAAYLARKYENSRQPTGSPFPCAVRQGDEDDNWADKWEEDRGYSIRDASGFPYAVPTDPASSSGSIDPSALAMMSFIPPPPPPGQEKGSGTGQVTSSSSNFTQAYPTQTHLIARTAQCNQQQQHHLGKQEQELLSLQNQEQQQQHQWQQQQQQQSKKQQQQHIVPPPPDLKPVVDKLANYVSRNGESFEEQIKKKRDPRFSFLAEDNIYYPYYLYRKQQKISEFIKKKAEEKREEKEAETAVPKPLRFAIKTKSKSTNFIRKTKTVDIFMEHHDDEKQNEINVDDGYRPNKTKMETTSSEMEAVSVQPLLDEDGGQKQVEPIGTTTMSGVAAGNNKVESEKHLQMQRRRKAAAFIGKLKQSNPQDSSSDSSNEDDESDRSESTDAENQSQPTMKRHFQENQQGSSLTLTDVRSLLEARAKKITRKRTNARSLQPSGCWRCMKRIRSSVVAKRPGPVGVLLEFLVSCCFHEVGSAGSLGSSCWHVLGLYSPV
eukprot:gene13807-15252_t